MRKYAAALFVVALILIIGVMLLSQDKGPKYPLTATQRVRSLKVGDTATYSSGVGKRGPFVLKRTVMASFVTSLPPALSQMSALEVNDRMELDPQFKNSPNVRQFGGILSTAGSLSDDSILCLQSTAGDRYYLGNRHKIGTNNGAECVCDAQPLLLMPSTLKAAQTWSHTGHFASSSSIPRVRTMKCAVETIETVKTAIGSFESYRISFTITDGKMSQTGYWWVNPDLPFPIREQISTDFGIDMPMNINFDKVWTIESFQLAGLPPNTLLK